MLQMKIQVSSGVYYRGNASVIIRAISLKFTVGSATDVNTKVPSSILGWK